MTISLNLLSLLRCPIHDCELVYDPLHNRLVNQHNNIAYPIIDSIPILLADKAINLNKKKI